MKRLTIEAIWKEVLRLREIDRDLSFMDLGGTSLNANQIVAEIQKRLGVVVPVLKIFEHPTLRQFTGFMEGAPKPSDVPKSQGAQRANVPGAVSSDKDIAIIGMACRFPGAKNVEEFWQNLIQGKDSIQYFSKEALCPEVPEELRSDPRYVRARGLIERPHDFDAAFFDINPMEAKLIDPQQRILLETAWEALENAGHGPGSYHGRTAVFAGVEDNTYYKTEIAPFPEAEKRAGHFSVMTANEKDYVAMRIAHKLDLKGPALSIHTACSTSLVAVIMACKSLRAGECEMALAGGAAVHFPANEGYYFQEGGVFSSDGHCRPFDEKAEGTIFTDGSGIVVLKRVQDAIRDRDMIYAVIKGGAINNDGGDKASFSAPSIAGQASCITEALSDAGVSAGTIQFLEAHGTATPMGDPIEVEALRQAFRHTTEARGFCGLGSVKSNIGHTTAAAGVASLIKMALSLKNKMVPATVHFKSPNPGLDLQNSPFYIVDRLTEWEPCESPRRAGLSSFGIGGTNSHVILEEAPEIPGREVVGVLKRPFEILPVSAKTETQRDRLLTELLDVKGEARDVAFSLQYGRSKFKKRGARIRFEGLKCEDLLVHKDRILEETRLVFMFPGQGSQYVEMGKSLFEHFPEFRETFLKCCAVLDRELELDFKSLIFDPGNKDTLENTRYTQPALFAIEVSLGQMLLDWGITPDAMIGHSIGEFAAAYLSGVFSLEDGLKLISARGRLMASLPQGKMLSVRGAIDQVRALAGDDVDLASINSPIHSVFAGEESRIAGVQARLEKAGLPCKLLHTSHAFHSRMMSPVVEPFFEIARKVHYQNPKFKIISAVTGKRLKDAEATDPMYWANHLRATVDFGQAMATSIEDGGNLFLEVGPRTTLTSLAIQHLKGDMGTAISTLGDSSDPSTELGALGLAIAKLWVNGRDVAWSRIWPGGSRIALGAFPFERKPFRFSENRQAEARRVFATSQITLEGRADVDSAAASSQDLLLLDLAKLFSEYSGVPLEQSGSTFVENGFDSLVLMQIGVELGKKYGISVSLRDLMDKQNTLKLLAAHLAKTVSSTKLPQAVRPKAAAPELMLEGAVKPSQTISPNSAQELHAQLSQMKDTLERHLKILAELSQAGQVAQLVVKAQEGLIRAKHLQPPKPGAFRANTPDGRESWFCFDPKNQRYEILE